MRDLLEAHRRPLRDLTGVDAPRALEELLQGSPRLSAPTAGMRLLWLATVALWAERWRVSERGEAAALDRLVV